VQKEGDPFQGGLAIGRAAALQPAPSIGPPEESSLAPAGNQSRRPLPVQRPEFSCFHALQGNAGGRSNSGVGSEKFFGGG